MSSAAPPLAGPTDDAAVRTTPFRRRYLLGLLLAIHIFNNLDRVALGLLMQDIKLDLGLSDTELGLLTGIAFALFYAIMGVPIARIADRGNRIGVIAITTFLWSIAVACCGAANNFVQMMFARMAVAVGEAGCVPPAQSLIADYFPRTERARALSIYMLGLPLSMVFGFFGAGWVSHFVGWRWMFVVLGLPGILLALLAWFTLREPRRAAMASRLAAGSPDIPDAPPPSLFATLALLWRNRTFRELLLCWSIVSFFGYGIQQWKAVFFIRSFQFSVVDLGMWFAIIYGASGLVGLLIGGELAVRRAAAREALQLRAMGVAFCLFGVLSAGVYSSSNPYVAFSLMALANIGFYLTYGPLFSIIQTLVPDRIRAVAIAILYLFANLVGMGFGPLAAGVLSDGLAAMFGAESLRYALLSLCPGYLWAGLHLWRASRTVATDLATDREAGR